LFALLLFDALRFIPLLCVLGVAAFQDYRCGEVKNILWLYAPIGFLITIFECLLIPSLGPLVLFSMIIGVVLAFALYKIKAFAGADTKALITISVSVPLTPLLTGCVLLAPVCVVVVSALVSLPMFLFKGQKTMRYLPYIWVGTFVSMLI
jgi:hypothetical protein